MKDGSLANPKLNNLGCASHRTSGGSTLTCICVVSGISHTAAVHPDHFLLAIDPVKWWKNWVRLFVRRRKVENSGGVPNEALGKARCDDTRIATSKSGPLQPRRDATPPPPPRDVCLFVVAIMYCLDPFRRLARPSLSCLFSSLVFITVFQVFFFAIYITGDSGPQSCLGTCIFSFRLPWCVLFDWYYIYMILLLLCLRSLGLNCVFWGLICYIGTTHIIQVLSARFNLVFASLFFFFLAIDHIASMSRWCLCPSSLSIFFCVCSRVVNECKGLLCHFVLVAAHCCVQLFFLRPRNIVRTTCGIPTTMNDDARRDHQSVLSVNGDFTINIY